MVSDTTSLTCYRHYSQIKTNKEGDNMVVAMDILHSYALFPICTIQHDISIITAYKRANSFVILTCQSNHTDCLFPFIKTQMWSFIFFFTMLKLATNNLNTGWVKHNSYSSSDRLWWEVSRESASYYSV